MSALIIEMSALTIEMSALTIEMSALTIEMFALITERSALTIEILALNLQLYLLLSLNLAPTTLPNPHQTQKTQALTPAFLIYKDILKLFTQISTLKYHPKRYSFTIFLIITRSFVVILT